MKRNNGSIDVEAFSSAIIHSVLSALVLRQLDQKGRALTDFEEQDCLDTAIELVERWTEDICRNNAVQEAAMLTTLKRLSKWLDGALDGVELESF